MARSHVWTTYLRRRNPSHEDLVLKFARIQDAGIPMLVIPGNHDIYPGRTDGSRTTAATFARLCWVEIAPETTRRYGYNTNPSGPPDQNHAVIALEE